MQYYKKINANRLKTVSKSENKAVCLNLLVSYCCQKASAKFRINAVLCESKIFYISEGFDETVAKLAEELGILSKNNSEILVRLENKTRELVFVIFSDENGKPLSEITLEIYSGIPDIAIRDGDIRDDLEKRIDGAFEKAK